MSDTTQLIQHHVKSRATALMKLSIQEISELPEQLSEAISLGGTQLTVTTWHDTATPDEHRVVVQALKRGLLIGRMYAAGFISDPNGVRELTVDELLPFL